MQARKTTIMVFCGIAIALNIALGTVSSMLKLPVYLDVIGTILIAVYFGPFYGAATGGLTNLLWGLLILGPKDIPFLIVNVAVGLIVGFISKKFGFKPITAIITGIILGIVCPLIGTPIGVWVYGGLTGTGFDFLFLLLQKTGQSVFASSFIAKLSGNLPDKILSCLLVSFLILSMPRAYKPSKNLNSQNKAQQV